VWFVGAALAIPGLALNPRLGQDLTGGVNPLATEAFPVEPVFAAGATLVCGALVASVAALLVRFHRSTGLERQQVKWVMLAGALLAIVLPTSAALWSAWPPIHHAPALAVPLLPLAVCLAIVRDQLYDIDLVLSRTAARTGPAGSASARKPRAAADSQPTRARPRGGSGPVAVRWRPCGGVPPLG
jgi:hypothetical protein